MRDAEDPGCLARLICAACSPVVTIRLGCPAASDREDGDLCLPERRPRQTMYGARL